MKKKTFELFGFKLWTVEEKTVLDKAVEPQPIQKPRQDSLVDKRVMSSMMPVSSKRQTLPGYESILDVLGKMALAKPEFELECLDTIRALSMHNPDVSKAVQNVLLANTEFTIEWNESVSERQGQLMTEVLTKAAKKWVPFADGIPSLCDRILAQLAINGAASYEKIPTRSLDGLESVEFPFPSNIYFFRDKKNKWLPVQKVPDKLPGVLFSRRIGNFIALNPNQYRYLALVQFGESPIGVPPMLAALDSITIQKSMSDNVAAVVEKLGLLGFLRIMMEAPDRKDGESDDAYSSRVRSAMQEYNPFAESALKTGFMFGLKDIHEIEMQNTSINIQGAVDLINSNDIKAITGLKMDGATMNRNNTSTETFARVVLALMMQDLERYQKRLATVLEDLFETHLNLSGYGWDLIKKISFEKVMIGDRVKQQQAEAMRIDNAAKMRDQGFVDQATAAKMVGVDKPHLPGPKSEYNDDGTRKQVEKEGIDPTDEGATGVDANMLNLRAEIQEFPYIKGDLKERYDRLSYSSGFWDENDSEFWIEYNKDISESYVRAVDDVSESVYKQLVNLKGTVTQDAIQSIVMTELYSRWDRSFVQKIKPKIEKHIDASYRYYRSLKAPLKGIANIPDSVFDTFDLRVLEFYKNNDNLYLGKFITDKDVRSGISRFIKEQHVKKGIGIGRDSKSLKAFRQEFGDLLKGKDWKINQILETTLNTMRNTGSVAYMYQARVEKFRIVEAMDNLTCPYCEVMHGQEFSVDAAFRKIQSVIGSPPEAMPLISPFLTSLKNRDDKYLTPDEISKMSAEDLQGEGIDKPSYHPKCRGRVAAV